MWFTQFIAHYNYTNLKSLIVGALIAVTRFPDVGEDFTEVVLVLLHAVRDYLMWIVGIVWQIGLRLDVGVGQDNGRMLSLEVVCHIRIDHVVSAVIVVI